MTVTQSRFNSTTGQTSLNLIRNAFYKYNLDQVIDLSTNAVIQIQQWQLISLLDLRAQALGLKGYLSRAVQDAEEIIRYVPTQAVGYLRLGQLLSMQGKQKAVIQIYEKALIKVKKDDDPVAYTEFVEGKKKAVEKSKIVVDFITLLPLEITDCIFELLPEMNKITCLDVSSGWHDRLVNCQMTWSTIYNDPYDEAAAALILQRAIPRVAKHVKCMRIDTTNMETGQKYLERLENGDFRKLKALEMTDLSVTNLTSTNMIMSFTNALWQTRNTLTELDMTFDYRNINTSITDILFYSPYLKRLVLELPDTLESSLGNVEYLGGPHLALQDLEMETSLTSGRALKPLLQYCPNIRRLCLKGCKPGVVDIVEEISNENLQIFAYNPSFDVTSLKEKDAEYYDGPPGLREIYSPNGGAGVPADSFLRLLRKNQSSLQTVYANMSMTDQQEERGEPYPNFHPVYEQWHFERIQHLTYWPDVYKVTEPMFLDSIAPCKSTSLVLFSAVDTPNTRMIVDTLIDLPPVEKMELSHMEHFDDLNDERSDALVRLFQYYATFPPEKQILNKVWFEYCNFITDPVLSSVAQLESLRIVQFSGDCTIPTADSLRLFLEKVSNRVVEVMLVKIRYVDDDMLKVLSNMECVEKISLERITWFTDDGIIHLVDHSKSLHTLTLDLCSTISEDTVSYVKSKIKSLEALP